jgi:hypothetical protein
MRRFGVGLAPALAIAMLLPAASSQAGGIRAGCVDGSTQEARAVASGEGDNGGGPTFTEAFYRATVSIDVSTDGLTKRDLAISIEDVCGFPQALESEAVQLAGSDGVAVISPLTRVYKGKKLLKGSNGADTMTLVVKLAQPSHWRPGEDGPVPTFSTRRAEVTD